MITFLCLRCHWLVIPQADVPVKFAVSVSKRSFKHAVQRNQVKRHIREVYRVSKQPLYQAAMEKGVTIACMFVFLGKEYQERATIEKSIHAITEKIIKKLYVHPTQ